jgi:predicted house-cleaning NTP pyrophosphatase (Maf/HAM1 superfamily)
MNEQELKQINDAMQAQASIEKTLEEFERLKTIKNEIVDVQGKMLEKQKQMAVKSQFLQKREAKSSEMLEAMTVYNKSSGYSISIQDSLR